MWPLFCNFLKISKADFLGFSNGGQTTIEIALRHSDIVNKIILASIFYKRDAAPPEFWKGFDTATLAVMPKLLREGFLAVNNNNGGFSHYIDQQFEKLRIRYEKVLHGSLNYLPVTIMFPLLSTVVL